MARPTNSLAVGRNGRATPGKQLERQFAALVREGRLRAGRRVPSTRRLAARLGVHRNTVAAAHRRLAERGLLEVRHGARSRVPRYAAPAAGTDCPRATTAAGATVEALCRDPATARLMRAELASALRRGAAPVEVLPEGPARRGDVAVALPGRAAARASERASPDLLVARMDARRAARRALRRAPRLGVVALLTASRVLREAVLADADRLRPGEVTVRHADPGRPSRAREAGRVADAVIADALAAGALWGSAASSPARSFVPLRLLSRESLGAIVRRLGGTPSTERRGGR